ncbi:MAG: sulfotransferase family 2 domain-containing protein [Chloroflexi bacterium]|jgi:hypothetical protein|nr:sulfotransferase family 2 domain-containing protein [Chloroflexota bacterium]
MTSNSFQTVAKQDNDSQPAVIFLHIPKTAGTTLLRILDRQYPPEVVHSFGADAHQSVVEYKALGEETRNKIRLLRGHMAYGLHEYLPNAAGYFTVLREPVARVISYYNFIRRTPDHYLYDEVIGKDLSLHALLESGLPLMMNDAQVRLLSGVWGEPEFGEVSLAMLETAQQNLADSFIVVGLTEQFDKTLLLLKEKLNWQQDISYQRLNVTRQGVSEKRLPKETVELIKRVNRQDIALYAYAQDLFKEQCSQQGLLFGSRVRYFQFLNKYQPEMDIKKLRTYSVRAKLRSLLR